MESTPFTLPNSRIEGSISNSYQVLFPNRDKKAEIFIPDFPLNWIDLQKKGVSTTAPLEIVLELIEKGMIK